MNFEHLSDHELVSDLQTLTGNERTLRARMIAHLVEVAERRLHLKRGYSSLFQFCLRKLEMSEGEAFRRITAARLVKRFPSLLGRIERGDIHISHLVLLRDHLTEENFETLIKDASRQPVRKVRELKALHFPKPDVPSRIRKLPRRRLRTATTTTAPATATTQPTTLTTTAPAALTPAMALATTTLTTTTPTVANGPSATFASDSGERVESAANSIAARSQTRADGRSAASEQATLFSSAPPRKVFASVEPLSAMRFKVQLTATKELRDKLERATQLMRHANPTGDLAVVIERALDMLIPKLESDKLGRTSRPQKNPRTAKTDHITRAARRDVFNGEEQCAFVGEGGHRCEERTFLEVDHVHPRALGGASDSSNLQLLCAQHNRFRAEQTFGRAYVEKRIRMRREKSSPVSAPIATPPTTTAPTQSAETLKSTGLDDVQTTTTMALDSTTTKARQTPTAAPLF